MGDRLSGVVVDRSMLPEGAEEEMYGLFRRYYQKVDRRVFDRDLEEKDAVLLLQDEAGAVRGFTTMKRYALEHDGRRVRVVFSGNTIIEQDFWGEQALARTFSRFLADVKEEASGVPLYWYLICSGFRTYMYLPLFFREFWPRCDRATPAFEGSLIDALGRMKFPGEYRDGVVHVGEPREVLRPELAVPPPHKLDHPHIGFFTRANPGYLRGNELVCLTEWTAANTRGLAAEIARGRAEVA